MVDKSSGCSAKIVKIYQQLIFCLQIKGKFPIEICLDNYKKRLRKQ